jgi:hypothetical protein
MAITTLDGALAGMNYPTDFSKLVSGTLVAARPCTWWYLGGYPGAGAAPAGNLRGAAISGAVTGRIPFTNPGAGNSYLARLVAMVGQAGTFLLCDRLWGNGGIGITTVGAQIVGNPVVSSSIANPTLITCTGNVPFIDGDTVRIKGHTGSNPAIDGDYVISNKSGATFTIPVNNLAVGSGGTVGIPIPARDANGLSAGTEVLAAVEVSANVGAGTPTLTLNYTNELGGGNRSATNILATTASPIAGSFHQIGLQAGDRGIQTVQSFALSATWTSGTIHVILYRVLARLPISAVGVPTAIDMLTGGFPRIFNDSVLFLVFVPSTTTSAYVTGGLTIAQG